MILANSIPYAEAATQTKEGTLAIRGYLSTDSVSDVDTSSYSAIRQWVEAQPPEAPLVFDIDSPGGDLSGLEALCAAIEAHKGPTSALISGLAASAGYWIASSCDEIAAAPSAMVGSVGVMMQKALEPRAETDVVAKLSPRKNAPDEQWQALIDAACDRFLAHVSRRRGWGETDLEVVAERVGSGKIMTAAEALKRGLIDRLEVLMDETQTPEVLPAEDKTMEDKVREQEARLADFDRRLEELKAIIDNLNREKADEEAVIDEEKAAEDEAQAACKPKAASLVERKLAAMAQKVDSLQKAHRDEHIARMVAQGRIDPADVAVAKIAWDYDRTAFERRYGQAAAMATVRVSSGASAPEKVNEGDAVAMAYSMMAKNPSLGFKAALKAAMEKGGK